ncbi:hypothetical protein TTHERM_000784429 (macronuclear) [Tetrahymena thermophila SB210]|uniref:Uncharacterized protein n=1 Tax=Tetrahymena thermophila (strain SB210) TaxID=312017 RepID=W7XFB0_TETTS|nr:hypothetical protein TTHERM_000784429 [Tetrahymena thermophila SB210]EWS75518.1 hypothetical protein TTHERM_000784429 [Tetrahymena thermophila SB210]|eukprot:XP_012651987.1 hypothetical protein TTHERM_000784429 [Tetrahymena thermophila SB210]
MLKTSTRRLKKQYSSLNKLLINFLLIKFQKKVISLLKSQIVFKTKKSFYHLALNISLKQSLSRKLKESREIIQVLLTHLSLRICLKLPLRQKYINVYGLELVFVKEISQQAEIINVM